MITHTSVGPAGIGILKLINTLFIVIAQLPATRVVKRMRRAKAFAVLCAVWVIALLAVLPATLIHSELGATALLAGVALMFAIGECMHAVVIGPLVADLAPEHLLGRYISVFGLMATAGLALGPAIGGEVLATSPDAVWWGGALVAAVIGAAFSSVAIASLTTRWPLARQTLQATPQPRQAQRLAKPRPTPHDPRPQHAARAIPTTIVSRPSGEAPRGASRWPRGSGPAA